jgi:hypothetical protein
MPQRTQTPEITPRAEKRPERRAMRTARRLAETEAMKNRLLGLRRNSVRSFSRTLLW